MCAMRLKNRALDGIHRLGNRITKFFLADMATGMKSLNIQLPQCTCEIINTEANRFSPSWLRPQLGSFQLQKKRTVEL